MNIDPEKFEIDLDGTIYQVERSGTDINVYRLKSHNGGYLLARDFYGVWVELTSKKGSPYISLNQAGAMIEDHYKLVNS